MEYGPHYELEISPGNMRNQNTQEYLKAVYSEINCRYHSYIILPVRNFYYLSKKNKLLQEYKYILLMHSVIN